MTDKKEESSSIIQGMLVTLMSQPGAQICGQATILVGERLSSLWV
jgi:hypothetical protein